MLAEIFLPASDLTSSSAAGALLGADDSGEEGFIADWLAFSGDYVHRGQVLGHAELGGGVVDIAAPATGVLHVLVPVDRPLAALSLLGVIDTAPDARAFTVTFTPTEPPATPATPPVHMEWTVDVATPTPWAAGPEAAPTPPAPPPPAVVPPVAPTEEAGPPAPGVQPQPRLNPLSGTTAPQERQQAPRLPLLSRQARQPAAPAERVAAETPIIPPDQHVPMPQFTPAAVESPAPAGLLEVVEPPRLEAPTASTELPAPVDAPRLEEPPAAAESLVMPEPLPESQPLAPSAPLVNPPSTPAMPAPRARLYASPRARTLARQFGVDVVSLHGSGPFGRVEEADVLARLASLPSATTQVASEVPAAEEAEVPASAAIIDVTATAIMESAPAEEASAEPVLVEPTLAEPAALEAVAAETSEAAPAPVEAMEPEPSDMEAVAAEASETAPATEETMEPAPQPVEALVVETIAAEPAPVEAVVVEATAAEHPTQDAAPTPLAALEVAAVESVATQPAATQPVVSLTIQADATALALLRQRLSPGIEKRTGAPLSYGVMLAKLVALALRDHPALNTRQAGLSSEIVPNVDVGLAPNTTPDQAIPVLTGAGGKDLLTLSREAAQSAHRPAPADGTPAAPSPASFTIVDLGERGVDVCTPALMDGQRATLGVGRVTARAVVRREEIVARTTVFLSLTYLAGALTAAQAAGFLTALAALVEDPAPLAEGLVY